MPRLNVTCKCSMMNFWENQQKLMWTSANNKFVRKLSIMSIDQKAMTWYLKQFLMPTMYTEPLNYWVFTWRNKTSNTPGTLYARTYRLSSSLINSGSRCSDIINYQQQHGFEKIREPEKHTGSSLPQLYLAYILFRSLNYHLNIINRDCNSNCL